MPCACTILHPGLARAACPCQCHVSGERAGYLTPGEREALRIFWTATGRHDRADLAPMVEVQYAEPSGLRSERVIPWIEAVELGLGY